MKIEDKIKLIDDLYRAYQTRLNVSRSEHQTWVEQVKLTIHRICQPDSKYIYELDTNNVSGIYSVYEEGEHYFGLLKRLKTELKLDQYSDENIVSLNGKEFSNVPATVNEIYNEIIVAFNQNLNFLCAGGLRAIIEAICKDKGIKDGITPDSGKRTESLKGRIFGLAEASLISSGNATILTHHQYLGDKALHELKKPHIDELNIAIEIINFTLIGIYELEHKGRELQTKIENRTNNIK